MTGMIEAMGTTESYFDNYTNKFKINITSIKTDERKRERNIIHLTNYPLEKYWSIDIYIILDGIEGYMRIYCTRHDDIHRADTGGEYHHD